jgi:hypothetical protein
MKQKQRTPASGRLPFWEKGEMTERLLQYIWQYQYFNRSALFTACGETLEVLVPGRLNKDQGPDFLDAQVRLDSTIFVGTIELHLKTSHWKEHGHHNDPNYRNVILHVVYEHNDETPSPIPVLELQSRIPRLLLEKYDQWMHAGDFIPCATAIGSTPALNWLSWKDRLLVERLTRKSASILLLLEQSGMHWEETCWWLLARNFGMTVNAEAFEAMARTLSMRILGRHRNQIHQMEALLLGQAGLLTGPFREDYPKLLQREYLFLKKKYGLQAIALPVHFLRMRPPNFPTIRLAQLAMFLHEQLHFFPGLLEGEDLALVREQLTVTANDYWHEHYLPGEPSAFRKKVLGKEMVDNLVVNTVAPLLFAYGRYQKEARFQDKAIRWLTATGGEGNTIIKGFADLGISASSAFDTQALIELKTRYCDQRLCLQCGVGHALLRS